MAGAAERPPLIPPAAAIEVARCTMGAIDLDPCSSPEANRVVEAARYQHHDDYEACKQPWDPPGSGRIFLGIASGLRLSRVFAHKLLNEYRAGRVKQAVLWLGASEILATCPWLWDFPICIPFRRLAPRYWDDELEQAMRVQPAGWSALIHMPPAHPPDQFQAGMARFHSAAGKYGRVILDQWSGDNNWWPASYRDMAGKDYEYR